MITSHLTEKCHLDLGCGKLPRNPYRQEKVFGIDIFPQRSEDPSTFFVQANLALQPIPFPDNYFDSVSAYDFLEHIPRVLAKNESATSFPFVNLMSEIWRVLKPNGKFFALTPAFPSPDAFHDPTHVNIITDKTHEYFCGKHPYAVNYGFAGRFEVIEIKWVRGSEVSKPPSLKRKWAQLRRKLLLKKNQATHLVWEIQAKKYL